MCCGGRHCCSRAGPTHAVRDAALTAAQYKALPVLSYQMQHEVMPKDHRNSLFVI